METENLYQRLEKMLDILKLDNEWEAMGFSTRVENCGNGNKYAVRIAMEEKLERWIPDRNTVYLNFYFPIEEVSTDRMTAIVREFTDLCPKKTD